MKRRQWLRALLRKELREERKDFSKKYGVSLERVISSTSRNKLGYYKPTLHNQVMYIMGLYKEMR